MYAWLIQSLRPNCTRGDVPDRWTAMRAPLQFTVHYCFGRCFHITIHMHAYVSLLPPTFISRAVRLQQRGLAVTTVRRPCIVCLLPRRDAIKDCLDR